MKHNYVHGIRPVHLNEKKIREFVDCLVALKTVGDLCKQRNVKEDNRMGSTASASVKPSLLFKRGDD